MQRRVEMTFSAYVPHGTHVLDFFFNISRWFRFFRFFCDYLSIPIKRLTVELSIL